MIQGMGLNTRPAKCIISRKTGFDYPFSHFREKSFEKIVQLDGKEKMFIL